MSIRKGRRLKKYLGLKWERINPLSSKEIIKVPKEPQKYLNNFLIFNLILRRRDWLFNSNEIKTSTNWEKLQLYQDGIYADKKNNVYFKPIRNLKNGWYLFGIRHIGENNYCFGKIKNGKYGFSQGRPMYPSRFRWRIIRKNTPNETILKLENIYHPLIVKDLWLFYLPSFEAWRRVLFRYYDFLESELKFKDLKDLPKIWKKYNKLFLLQRQKPSTKYIFSYKNWCEKIELPLLKSILKNKTSNNYKNLFILNDLENFKEVHKGKFVITKLDGDIIPDWAFFIFFKEIKQHQNCKLIYSDEDYISKSGFRTNPHFKPSWNKELFLSDPNFSRIWIVDIKLWNYGLRKLKSENIRLNIRSLILEISNHLEKNNKINSIRHLPLIAYHKLKNNKAEKRLISNYPSNYEFLNQLYKNKSQLGECIKISNFNNVGIRYHWKISENTLLSIFIPTRDRLSLLKKCLESIYRKDPGVKIEIIIIDNDSVENKTKEFLKRFSKNSSLKIKKKVVKYTGAFNYSKLNNYAAKYASGNVFLLLNNDVEFITANWGYELASNALRPNIGFVGAKLFYSDKTIQHAGIILGIGGIAGHSHKYFSSKSKGYKNRLCFSQELSAVTGACMSISKRNWSKLNGLDENNLKVNYNDVDICLRANLLGLKNIFLPQVHAFHLESKSRGKPIGKDFRQWKDEAKFMKKRWGDILLNDPHYSPYLSLKMENFSLSLRAYKKIYSRTNDIKS